MRFLGIESTAHTIGIGIYDDKKGIMSNIFDTYMPEKGILPREAADHHSQYFPELMKKALDESKSSIDDIDVISVAQGPGIGAPLSFGVYIAKFLASYYRKDIVGVNHPYAHIKIAEYATKMSGAIIVYVSGANTQILYEEKGFYTILGETLDIGIGNLLDTFARKAGIKPAHGSALAEIAKEGKFIELPYTVKGMNLQFSGLLTAGIRALEKHSLEDVAYSLMHTAYYMVAEVAERAFHLKKAKGFLLCGGVAQSRELANIFKKLAEENETKVGIAPPEYNRDNGAMIAYAGSAIYHKWGKHVLEKIKPLPYYRIDLMPKIIKDLSAYKE